MNGDVRSLEEVIAAEIGELIGRVGPDYTLTVTAEALRALQERIAAAVREWCLAPQQIERAKDAVWAGVKAHDGNRDIARAALHAVMGDTPDDSKVT